MGGKLWAIAAAFVGATALAGQPPVTQPAPAGDAPDAPTYVTIGRLAAEQGQYCNEISHHFDIDFLWAQRSTPLPQPTLNLKHVPLCVALEKICKATHSVPALDRGDRCVPLNAGDTGMWDQEGQFAVVAAALARQRTIDLTTTAQSVADHITLNIYNDPKAMIFEYHDARVTLAVDEHGVPLTPQYHGEPVHPGNPRNGWGFSTSAALEIPPNIGKKAARLEGFIVVLMADRVEPVSVADISKMVGKPITSGNRTLTITALQFTSKTGGKFHIHLTKIKPEPPLESPMAMFAFFDEIEVIRFHDAAGKQVEFNGEGESTATDCDSDGDFSVDDAKSITGPISMEWQSNAEMKSVDIPFKFKDLPLPGK